MGDVKIGRNDPCYCGSGKKFKHCHGISGAISQSKPSADASPSGSENIAVEKSHIVNAINEGKFHEAELLLRPILFSHNKDSELYYFAGFVAFQLGNVEQSIDYLKFSQALNSTSPDTILALAQIYLQTNQLNKAAEAFEKYLVLEPASLEVLNNLGNVYIELGKLELAAGLLVRALSIDPHRPEVNSNLGTVYFNLGKIKEAESYLSRAVKAEPSNFDFRHNLAQCLFHIGKVEEAIVEYQVALDLRDSSLLAWQGFVRCFSTLSEPQLDDRLRSFLVRCLENGKLDISGLSTVVLPIIQNKKGIKDLDEIAATILIDTKNVSKILPIIQEFNDPLILGFLKREILSDSVIEQILTNFRKIFLVIATKGMLPDIFNNGQEEIFYAIANNCFLNEYIFQVSEKEKQQLNDLESCIAEKIKINATPNPLEIALIASYKPLNQSSFKDENVFRAMQDSGQSFSELIRQQVLEPEIERELSKYIKTLSEIEDVTSKKVRDQYETNPYPRWQTLSVVEQTSFQKYMLKSYPYLGEIDVQWPNSPSVLIAGCGTGRQPVSVASCISCKEILAIDLSQKSIGYSLRKTKEMGLTHIHYLQADILELKNLQDNYDLIDCSGVLHHMLDPMQGWSSLIDHLRPKGFMRIGLYSELARRYIVQAQDFVRERDFPSTDDGIREFRQEILNLENSHPLKNITRYDDFYTLSNCRDMFFHVQEHRFTIPKIIDALDQLDLNFIGFEFVDPNVTRMYKATYLDDTSATSLTNWHEFEQDHPDIFHGMYSFWLYNGEF